MKMFRMIFSKALQAYRLEELGAVVKGMGFDAVDLTVRPGGHVEPQAVATELPRAAKLLGEHGVGIGALTTAITSQDTPHAREVLEAAAKVGVRHYKPGYFAYRGFGSLREDRDAARASLATLAEWNLELGLCAGCHNHSGPFLGASLWDLDEILRDLPREAFCIYLDPAHAAVEGSYRGWEMGFDLVKERVGMLAVKDFGWMPPAAGSGWRQLHRVVPLGHGFTPWGRVLKLLGEIGFAGPVSFHSEYDGEPSFTPLSQEELVHQSMADLGMFSRWQEG